MDSFVVSLVYVKKSASGEYSTNLSVVELKAISKADALGQAIYHVEGEDEEFKYSWQLANKVVTKVKQLQ